MTRTLPIATAVLFGVVLLAGGRAYSGDSPNRASLGDLQSIGQIIVAMPTGPPEGESALREVIERRLSSAGMAVDSALETQLVVDVQVTRDSSPRGQKHFSYRISLSFQEPVRAERMPRAKFRATTWSSTSALHRFSLDVPFEAVADAVDNSMNRFLSAVAMDTASQR